MKIERPKNYFCRGEIEVHKAMQRQTEREIERMRRWAREDNNNTNFSNIEEMVKLAQKINKMQIEAMSDNAYNSNPNGITINNTFIFR